VSELDFDSKDDSLGLFDNDPLAIPPSEDYDLVPEPDEPDPPALPASHLTSLRLASPMGLRLSTQLPAVGCSFDRQAFHVLTHSLDDFQSSDCGLVTGGVGAVATATPAPTSANLPLVGA